MQFNCKNLGFVARKFWIPAVQRSRCVILGKLCILCISQLQNVMVTAHLQNIRNKLCSIINT